MTNLEKIIYTQNLFYPDHPVMAEITTPCLVEAKRRARLAEPGPSGGLITGPGWLHADSGKGLEQGQGVCTLTLV